MDAKPIVKCNLEAVLKGNEPPSVTRSWVAIIETITPMRTNTGFPIKEAVEYAQRAAKDVEVKKYLSRALRYFKGNAAGTTKFAALWLAAQVRRHKPEMWTLEAMQAPDPHREGGAITPPPKGLGEEGAEVGAALAELEEEGAEEEEEEDEDVAAAAAAAAEAALAEVEEEGAEDARDGAEDEEGEEADVGHEVEGTTEDVPGGGGGMTGSTAGGTSSSAPVADAMEVEGEAPPLPTGATQMAVLSSANEVDCLLWEGAAAEGWRVRQLEFDKPPVADVDAEGSSGSGGGGHCGHGGRGGNVVDEFLGPSTNVYASRSAAVDARAAEDALSVRASVAANPSILVGWRVFVFWSGSEQNELGGRGGWFGAQVVGWREVASTGKTEADGGGKQGGHSLVYDDMSTEEVDLTSVKYQLGYPLLSAQLQPGRRALRPAPTDVTSLSWPILAAAAVLRMTAHDDAARAAVGCGSGGSGGSGGSSMPGPSSTPTARATTGAVGGSGALVSVGAVAGAGLGRDASDLALGAHEAALALLQRPSAEGAESFSHLSAPQRLAILAYLVEQATDTEAAGKAILEVHERTSALLDAFEKEDKEARRKQKDNKDDLKSAVRQWLLKEGGATSHGSGAELGADVDVTDAPNSAPDAVVTAEVQRMLDCEQCLFRYPGVPGGSLAPYVGKMMLTVLTLAELRATEAELCMQLELQASGIDENGRELSAHALVHSNARRDEMRRRRDVLPPARQAALAQLTAAVEAHTADALITALGAARLAALEGDGAVDMVSGVKGGRWMVPEVRDATKAPLLPCMHVLTTAPSPHRCAMRPRRCLRSSVRRPRLRRRRGARRR